MRRRLLLLGALGASAPLLLAHTPYPRWYRYRARHTVIAADREDPRSFPLGERLARYLADRVPDLRPEAARAQNPRTVLSLLKTHQLDLALLRAEDAYRALRGASPYAALRMPLRALAFLSPEYFYVVVPERSAARTVADLQGKQVGLVESSGRVRSKAYHLVEAFGLDASSEIQWQSLQPDDAARALASGSSAAICFESPLREPAHSPGDLLTAGQVRLLPQGDAIPRLLIRHGPIYFRARVGPQAPALERVEVMGELRLLVCREDYPPARAKALSEALTDWEELVPAGEVMVTPIPMHSAVSPPQRASGYHLLARRDR